jgi:hypothetical protein
MAFAAERRLSDDELDALFARLFPAGWAGDDVLSEIAPAGWEASPLLATYHPSLEQVYGEACQFHGNIQALRRPDDERPVDPEPTFEAVRAEYRPTPVDTAREVRELVGKCLWDLFSDNHDVIAADGRSVDLGSFRASGGFLADLLNRQAGSFEYDYMDFYMGTI